MTQDDKSYDTKLSAIYEKTCEDIATSKNSYDLFSSILSNLLELTDSEYGFIGRVLHKDGKPYLKTAAITNIAWNDETLKMYQENVENGLEFYNMQSLFGKVILDKNLVITNKPSEESFSAGIPEGHPALNSFLGIPLKVGNNMIGMACFANRPTGYDESLYNKIEKYCNLCSQLLNKLYQDINARKDASSIHLQKEAKDEVLQSLLSNMVESVIIIHKNSKIEFMNEAALDTFQYTPEEIIGEDVKVLMPEPHKTYHDSYVKKYIKTGKSKIIDTIRELEAQKKNGDIFPMELSVCNIDKKKNKFLGIIRDISERKKIEKIKEELVALVSHELRTPITSIKGSLGILATGKIGELSDKGLTLVNVAKTNCDRLVRLLNDILDFEKIKSGKMFLDMKKKDLCKVVKASANENQGFAENYNVNLVAMFSPKSHYVLCDEDKINQVITNLLSNAIKFSPKGGSVEVSIDDFDEQYVVNIKDYGGGISKEDQKKIFEAFTQVDSSTTREKSGTGLGLAISKKIIELHHGEIGLDSELGKGTTIHFCIPKYIDIVVNDNKKKLENTMLICESDQEVLLVIRYILKEIGLDSRYVINSQMLKRELNHSTYSCVIIDYYDLQSSAQELIDEIVSVDDMKKLPIIIIADIINQNLEELKNQFQNIIAVIDKSSIEDDLKSLIETNKDKF